MSDIRTAATFGSKIFFFVAACVLGVFMFIWPHVFPNSRYEVTEINANTPSGANDNASALPHADESAHTESPAPVSTTTRAEPVPDIEEGEMVFKGKTQLIITPRT